jgi:4-hydroxy-tetrahydrodipicolinate synthase
MHFGSVFPPMPTPFTNGEVDPSAIRFNVERWMRAGLGGVVALGTNGESALLDEDESDRVIAAAREAIPSDRLLIAGTGRESTRATIAAAKRAAAHGADAVLVRTPSFFKSLCTPALFARYYTAVADASPVPVLLYHFPAAMGVTLLPETVAQLGEHPNIAGMKESSTDAAQLAAFVDATGPTFSVIVGTGAVLYAGLCLGAVGGILAVAAVMPELCVRLLAAVSAGQHEEARQLQKRIAPIGRMVTSGYGVPGLKAALDLAGFKGGEPRAPLAPATREAQDQIRAELARVAEVV